MLSPCHWLLLYSLHHSEESLFPTPTKLTDLVGNEANIQAQLLSAWNLPCSRSLVKLLCKAWISQAGPLQLPSECGKWLWGVSAAKNVQGLWHRTGWATVSSETMQCFNWPHLHYPDPVWAKRRQTSTEYIPIRRNRRVHYMYITVWHHRDHKGNRNQTQKGSGERVTKFGRV